MKWGMTKLLLYCTKAKQKIRVTEHLYTYADDLYKLPNGQIKFGDSIELATYESNEYNQDNFLNGKIVAECECEKIEVFTTGYRGDMRQNKEISKDSCLSLCDLVDYQKENHFLYAIHISNLQVFDEPKELSEYNIKLTPQKLVNPISKDSIVISNINYCCTKAPQNMCNVYDNQGNRYILISIRPEHLCKILNGEKTIEVRKKISNSLKEVL